MKLGMLALGLAAATLLAVPAVAAVSMDVVDPAADQAAPAAAPAASDADAAKGKQEFQEICGTCHDLAVSTGQMKSREDWQATVSRMANEGAPLTDEQISQVVAYLSKNYGSK